MQPLLFHPAAEKRPFIFWEVWIITRGGIFRQEGVARWKYMHSRLIALAWILFARLGLIWPSRPGGGFTKVPLWDDERRCISHFQKKWSHMYVKIELFFPFREL
jgi:hypothetical protein